MSTLGRVQSNPTVKLIDRRRRREILKYPGDWAAIIRVHPHLRDPKTRFISKKSKKDFEKKNEENLNWILDSVSLASELIYSAPHRASSNRSKSKTGTLSGTLTIIAKQGLFYYTRAALMLRLLLFFSYLMPAWHRLNSPLPLHHHFAVARRFRASLDRNFTFCCQCLGQA